MNPVLNRGRGHKLWLWGFVFGSEILFFFFPTVGVVQCFHLTPGDAVGSSALEISQIQVEEVMYGIFSIGDNPFSSRRQGEVIF